METERNFTTTSLKDLVNQKDILKYNYVNQIKIKYNDTRSNYQINQ